MTATNSWYEVIDETTLAQGDVLLSCPIPVIETYTFPLPENLDVLVDVHHVIVLSQSCDLENDKVDEVLLGAVLEYDRLVALEGDDNPSVKGKNFRKAAVRGDLAAYSLLPEASGPPSMAWALVDFHHLFTLPKSYLEEFCAKCGVRLRLVPPYREHLAQAFARYVMRVGLPTALDQFERVVPAS